MAGGSLTDFKLNDRRSTSRPETPDDDVLDEIAGHQAGEVSHMLTHPNVGGAGIHETCLRRQLKPLADEIDHRPSAADLPWQRLERMSHAGARPLTSNSSRGTRNMLSATRPCRAGSGPLSGGW